MHIVLVALLAIVVFAVQIMLCFRYKKTHIRAIPAMLMAALMALCGLLYVLEGQMPAAALTAVVGIVVLAILLVVDALSWLTYCIIRFVQKVR